MKAATQKTINAPALYRVRDKATEKTLGYLVPSDQEGHKPYQVTYDANQRCFVCPCQGFGRWHHCKHVDAVTSNVEARKQMAEERKQQEQTVSVEAVMAAAQETVKRDEDASVDRLIASVLGEPAHSCDYCGRDCKEHVCGRCLAGR